MSAPYPGNREYAPSQDELSSIFQGAHIGLETNGQLNVELSEGAIQPGLPQRIFRTVHLSGAVVLEITEDSTIEHIKVQTRQSPGDPNDPEKLEVELTRGAATTFYGINYERASFAQKSGNAFTMVKVLSEIDGEDEFEDDMDELDDDSHNPEYEQARSITAGDIAMLGRLATVLMGHN